MPDTSEFLNPKSMITPGLAGGMTMAIANTLWQFFGLPQPITGLIISVLFALSVSAVGKMIWWKRGSFVILNSLIVFTMAMGVNTAGMAASQRGVPGNQLAVDDPVALAAGDAFGQVVDTILLPPPPPPPPPRDSRLNPTFVVPDSSRRVDPRTIPDARRFFNSWTGRRIR